MVVKFMKWSSWSTPPVATRKFNVKVKPIRLEGLEIEHDSNKIDDEEEKKEKVVMLKIKWEGEQGKFGFGLFNRNKSRLRKDFSSQMRLKKGDSSVEWNNDEFENICSFTIIGGDDNNNTTFESPPWILSFSILYGEKAEHKGKMAVLGKVSIDIAEESSKMEAQVERELLVKFHVGGVSREAILVVRLSLDEIRELQANSILAEATNSANKPQAIGGSSRVSTEVAQRLGLLTKSASFSTPITRSNVTKKMGFFSFKRRRLSKEEPVNTNRFSSIISGLNKADDANPDKSSSTPQESNSLQGTSGNENQEEYISTDSWVIKEITSRDGRTKLKTSMFFASFDQRSDKAAGESACSVLATVISYWLHSNKCTMPTRSEFDNLIIEGSAEWRKLCGADTYMNDFPNKHFDLETIMHADIRPISISHNQSFIGFFGPEKFECLKGVRSFDEIWDEIEKGIEENEPRVYIISWNDHFFVMKFEKDSIYMIDTLGERLFEGCNQAYVLKFEESSEMAAKKDDEAENGEDEVICNGRECCKEFIKRFFAAIPVEELEEEEKKKQVSYFSLHHRLQIEFNFSYPLYPPSSSTSSPFSHSSTSTPSPLHG